MQWNWLQSSETEWNNVKKLPMCDLHASRDRKGSFLVGRRGRSAPEGVKFILCADGNPHAQAPSVPIRRAGRRARDGDRVRTTRPSNLQSPFVNGASKFIRFWGSWIWITHRKFWEKWLGAAQLTVAKAVNLQGCQLLFVTFSLGSASDQRKSYRTEGATKTFL